MRREDGLLREPRRRIEGGAVNEDLRKRRASGFGRMTFLFGGAEGVP
jgi:hypothetical protein